MTVGEQLAAVERVLMGQTGRLIAWLTTRRGLTRRGVADMAAAHERAARLLRNLEKELQ